MSESETRGLDDVPLHHTSVNGLSLAYREWGEGEPLVLIHGLGAHSGLWRMQAAVLGRRFRVVAVDLRGFGASDRPQEPSAYRVGHFVSDVLDLAAELELGRIHCLGTSMGGFVAASLALREPERVRTLILAHTAARLTIPDEVLAARVKALRATSMADYGKLVATQALALGERSPIFDWTARMIAANDRRVYEWVLTESLRDFDVRGRVSSITVPTLVIVGDSDRVIPPESGRELAGLIPGARVETLIQAGHLGYAEQPEHFNALVTGFLSALAARG